MKLSQFIEIKMLNRGIPKDKISIIIEFGLSKYGFLLNGDDVDGISMETILDEPEETFSDNYKEMIIDSFIMYAKEWATNKDDEEILKLFYMAHKKT